MVDLRKWKFGIDNNKLINLVLSNKKQATSSLCYDDGFSACIVKTLDYRIMKFSEMTIELAKLEGEGDLSLH